MKIAFLIDSLEARGGGEKVAYFFAKRYDVDIYTAHVSWDKILPEFKRFRVHELGRGTSAPFLQQELMMRKFRGLDLSEYDVVVCHGPTYSTYAALNNHPSVLMVAGISPLFYKTGPDKYRYWPLGKPYLRPAVRLWAARLRRQDKQLIRQIDAIVCISDYTRGIMKKYYGVDSTVIHPPIEARRYYNRKNKGYYLTVDRLIPEKRVDMVVEAFTRMPDKKLVVEGSGPEKERLEMIAGDAKNITFVGRVDSKRLLNLYANCIALINMGYYQDWSMVMIEAMASGKPGIGPRHGAYNEMIDEGRTGTLIDETVDGIIGGVTRITPEVAEKMKRACTLKASKCDEKIFYRKWDKLLHGLIEKRSR